MPTHRIRLRGPWELASAVEEGGNFTTLHLPAPWPVLLQQSRPRVRLLRRFNRPTNLAAEDEVSIVVEDLPMGAQVALNETSLDRQAGERPHDSAFITRTLQPSNVLSIEFETVELAALAATRDELRPWGEVAVVIRSP